VEQLSSKKVLRDLFHLLVSQEHTISAIHFTRTLTHGIKSVVDPGFALRVGGVEFVNGVGRGLKIIESVYG